MKFLLAPVSAVACAILADKKGRSAIGWFFMGLFMPILGVILIAVIPDRNEEQTARGDQRDRTRRVEEELRQERSRREALEREVQVARERIDMHDQALGIETRPLDPPAPRDPRYMDPTRDDPVGEGSSGWLGA
ncbi:MAG: hypothetical protein ACI8QC_000894 [Planctomycetota bacterium]|jgi:hypothetical protein